MSNMKFFISDAVKTATNVFHEKVTNFKLGRG